MRLTSSSAMFFDDGNMLHVMEDPSPFIVIKVYDKLSMEVMRYRWWHRVLCWNPCNNLGDLYNV